MIVKIFKSHGSASASLDYLENKPDDHAKLLQGDPQLSRDIADSIEYATPFTVGCLSFEEPDIPEQHKREIMERFEKSFMAGLEQDQYNITWIQHTDKGRLELNFFIPNVELTSGKRIQPYYDKADRPLAENFKQVINHEYSLSDPNAPEKKQTLIERQDLPQGKKEALEAINSGITALAQAGKIHDRQDVINALETAGFEIARVTPRNLSIKTDGQNLRLKGAFYEETFRLSDNLSADIAGRTEQYQRERAERYQTARERLDRAVKQRKQQFGERYPSRATEITEKHNQSVAIAEPNNFQPTMPNAFSIGGASVESEKQLSRDDRVAKFSRDNRENNRESENHNLHDRRRQGATVCSGQYEAQRNVGEKGRGIPSFTWVLENGDRNRSTFRERFDRAYQFAKSKLERFAEKVRAFGTREPSLIATIQRNQPTISELRSNIEKIGKVVEQKQEIAKQAQAKHREQSNGMSL